MSLLWVSHLQLILQEGKETDDTVGCKTHYNSTAEYTEKNRKRITYNSLATHDYTVDKPSLREILPGHFVHCNDAEEAQYKKELGL